MQTNDLDQAIQNELRLIAAIKTNTRRLNAPLYGVLLRTFLPPAAVFGLLGAAIILVSQTVERLTPGTFLNITVYVIGLIATIWLTRRAWFWAEARFGGMKLLRRLGQVTMAVLQAEKAVEAGRAKAAPTPDDIAHIAAQTQAAWNVYTEAMRAYGLQVEQPT